MTTSGQPFCALQADDEIQEVACTNITVLDSLVYVARKRHVITKSPIHAENYNAPAPILAETNFDCSLHDRMNGHPSPQAFHIYTAREDDKAAE